MKHFQFTIRQLILIYGALKVVHQHVQMSEQEREEVFELIQTLEQLLQDNKEIKEDETYDEYLEYLCKENTKKYGPS